MIATSTDVSIAVKDSVPVAAEAVVVFLTEELEPRPISGLTDFEHAALGRLLASGAAKGKARELLVEVVESSGKTAFRRLIVAGLGKAPKATAETIRQAAGKILRALRTHRLSRAAVMVPSLQSVGAPATAEAIVAGALLAAFDFDQYRGTGRKKDDSERPTAALSLTLVADRSDIKTISAAALRGQIIADGQNFARTIASRPGNDINPPALARVAQAMARQVGLSCRILDEKQMQKLGMGGILAVGAGSVNTPPRMIVLEHAGAAQGGKAAKRPPRAAHSAPLLVVGKAITFDTGGISIKPAEKMGRMIFDKCGAMAVLGLMYAVAKLRIPIRVVGILSSAENAISAESYRPGDILKMYNGVTVEVTNTDAEGRLVLGDALAWGIETYKPAAVVDLATLTGGVVVALGKSMAGAMANDDGLMQELSRASETAGEKIWPLPLNEDLRDFIRSDCADIVNANGREGHPLQGGAFLSFFVRENVPWCHLDIAGPADTEKELPYYAKGATGWGVRTLVEWVDRRAAKF